LAAGKSDDGGGARSDEIRERSKWFS